MNVSLTVLSYLDIQRKCSGSSLSCLAHIENKKWLLDDPELHVRGHLHFTFDINGGWLGEKTGGWGGGDNLSEKGEGKEGGGKNELRLEKKGGVFFF